MVYYDDSGRRIYRRIKRRTPAPESDAAGGSQAEVECPTSEATEEDCRGGRDDD